MYYLTCFPGLSRSEEYQMLGSFLKYQQFVKICEELKLLSNDSLSFTNWIKGTVTSQWSTERVPSGASLFQSNLEL